MDSRPPSTREGEIRATFGDLVAEHQVMVYRYARFLVGNAQLAEEIAQDTFITAYTKVLREAPTGEIGAWLRGIARNLALRARSKRSSRMLFCDDETLEMAESLWIESHETAPKSAQTDGRLEALRKCVSALSDPDRDLLRLRFEERRSRDNIAEELKLSVEGVKTRLRRLRTKLLECTQRRLAETGGSV